MKKAVSRREALRILAEAAWDFRLAWGIASLPLPLRHLMAADQHPTPSKSFPMLSRKIPASGELLPVVGIGSWEQFDVTLTPELESQLSEVLQQVHHYGGRVIDSSPMYGRSEAVLGDLTAALPQQNDFFYATKVWTSGREAGIRQMRTSLKLMRRQKMDLMQIHNLQDWQTHLPVLNDGKKEGLIRYTGITHYTASAHGQLETLVRKKLVDFAQFNFSIGDRHAEKSLLPACSDHGVAVLINEPFGQGALFRRVKGKPLPALAGEIGATSWAQFFLKYILCHPAVTCVIPGTSNPAHAKENMLAAQGILPDAALRKKMVKVFEG